MKSFDEKQIKQALTVLNGQTPEPWMVDDGVLTKKFRFSSFVEAFTFMTAMAHYAEKVDHHPDWSNCYRDVDIRLRTFDAHGLTQQDFDFALQAEQQAN